MPVQKVCGQCGGQFNVPPRRADEVKFCSRECKTAAGRETIQCPSCAKPFERVKSANARSASAYCSRECYHSSLKGRALVLPVARPRYFKTCETCKVEFRVTKTRAETARFCSRKCQGNNEAWAAECSEKQQGAKGWRWSGGKYFAKSGYVREKRNVLGTSTALLEHRKVIQEAMLKLAPWHPFLIEVNGKKVLSSQIEVHHIDRVRENNELSNLLAVTKDAHAQIHHRNRKPDPWECWPPNPEKW